MIKVPKSFYNWLSITGFILAVNSLVLILFLFIFSLTSSTASFYLGMYTYIVLPVFLVIGLILIPLGMIVKVKKVKDESLEQQRWPVLDMNLQEHRSTLLKVTIVTFLFLVASAMGSYQAFRYTESVEFCGKLCHKVMEPEHTTYLNSPHARVACVECHVGEGASWYVRSKLSGLYQVYSVLFHKYSTPITTPLMNLRPARETCEKCHWPQKFYARKLVSNMRYLADSSNTEWTYSLVMKIGPNFSAWGLKEGIHWHINPDVKIDYIAGTRDRESIPWVKYTNLKTGEVKIFRDSENKLEPKAMDTLEHRTVDCMDCHNRPSHLYRSAPVYVDNAIVSGMVPNDLPYIKKISMDVLKDPFTNKDSALAFIRDSINGFYRVNHPDLYKSRRSSIDKAITGISHEYSNNAFPSMRVESSKYLNHIGHLESDGCFRCHSGHHKTEKGETISHDCNLCHTIIAQGPRGNVRSVPLSESMEFNHPVDIGDAWKTGFCSECHRRLYE
ncbi:MAG: NapC/NirT family cytochrome c [Bacteroidetes bacterium]|nr:NapC/NirT family cytochrome c [Bacteroidota bacterium]